MMMSGDTVYSTNKVNNFQSYTEIKERHPGRLGHHLIGVSQKLEGGSGEEKRERVGLMTF